jgi:hypothetical protein
MSNIFINYRREDSSAYAGRLYDALLAHFGRDKIFIDIDAIGPGEDFRQVIQRTCASCEILLAVIGRSWATVQDKNGKPRLTNETDFVRLEIASALQKNLRVIPVLVGGADMPDASLLPTDLQPLAFRNAWEISDKRFHQDVEGLIDAIKKMLVSSAKEEVSRTPSRPNIPEQPAVPPAESLERGQETPLRQRSKMRQWGLVVTLFYVAVLLVLVVPATLYLGFFPFKTSAEFFEAVIRNYSFWLVWLILGIPILGEVLLLWLSVDTTRKRLKPRTHILVSAITTALLVALLTSAVLLALALVWRENEHLHSAGLLGTFFVPWLLWGILFHRLSRDADDAVTRAVSWLFRGSVLELLIVVPSHVILRRRNDCSAPFVTAYGIATGIAIMLLSFGPSVLILYKKRMEKSSSHAPIHK